MRIEKKEAIVVDIDGTIADNSHRTHLVEGKKKDWSKFFDKMGDDKPIRESILLVQKYFREGLTVLIATGRLKKYEVLTTNWLDKHIGVDEYLLFQRENNDFRSSVDLKKEIILNIQGRFDIKIIMENDEKIVQMYKAQGLNCIKLDLK